MVLADIAAGQWGLVTTPQARAAGFSRMQLSRLNRAGLLTRLSHGVYALRGSMGEENLDLAAAWLSLEPARLAHERLADLRDGPVVSHASAASLHGLGDLDADRHEFTTATRKQTRRPDVRLHRGDLDENGVTRRGGLPVTTPARTIADLLADNHDTGHVAGVLADAVRTHQIELDDLAARVGPHAARLGFPRGDGQALVRHLLELGGAAEQADADRLAAAARAHHLTVGELVQVDQLKPMVETIAALEEWLAPQRQQLAEIAAVLSRTSVMTPGQEELQRIAASLDRLVPPVPDSAVVALGEAIVRTTPAMTTQNDQALKQVAALIAPQIEQQTAALRRAIAPAVTAALEAALDETPRRSSTRSEPTAERNTEQGS